MPSNLLTADTSFPDLKSNKSTEEKFGEVSNYLYMLLEQLRYTLANLGVDNFNDAEIDELANIINEPIYIQLDDQEGNISSLYVEVDNVTSRMQNAEGNISTLQQTAVSLTSRISDAEGSISTLTQTVNSISLSVVNGTESSTIRLSKNGIIVSSANISFSGMVTFTDLSTQGQTVINGGNIAAGGTISGVTLQSMSGMDSGFEVCYGTRYSYQLVGGLKYDANGSGSSTEAATRMFLYTQSGWALKLDSGSSASFTANGLLYQRGANGAVLSGGNSTLDLRGTDILINGTSLATYIQNVVG